MFTTVDQVKTIITNFLTKTGRGGFITGTVSSVNPLKIQINARLEITEENLYISDNCIGLSINDDASIREPLAVGDGVVLITRPSTTDGTKYILLDRIQSYSTNKNASLPVSSDLENGGTINGDLNIDGNVNVSSILTTKSLVVNNNGKIEKNSDMLFMENLIAKSRIALIDASGNFVFYDTSNASNHIVRMRVYKSTGSIELPTGGFYCQSAGFDWDPGRTLARIYNAANGGWLGVGGSGIPQSSLGRIVVSLNQNIANLNAAGSYLEVTRSDGIAFGCNWWQSDTRLKKNIEEYTDAERGLKTIMKIEPISFDWKETDEHIDLGLSANQLELIQEDLILKIEQGEDSPLYDEEEPFIRQINESALITELVLAVQQQQTMINCQTEQMSELKSGIELLKKEIEILKGDVNG